MRRGASAFVAFVVQSMIGASGAVSAAEARGSVIHVVVVDAGTDKPIKSAKVTLCRKLVEEPGVVFNRRARWCEDWFTDGATKRNGEVALKWAGTTADLARASVIAEADPYLDGYVAGSELSKLAGPTQRLRIALNAGAKISAHVTRPDGTPVADGKLGWVARDGGVLRARHMSYYSAATGEVSFDPYEIAPVGEVTVFAFDAGPSPRLAVARALIERGRETTVALEVRQPLLRVQGKVVTAEGAPLTAMIAAEPTDPAAPLVDRALLALGAGPTKTTGEFELLAAPGARFTVRASTWIPGDGSMSHHVGSRPLAEVSVDLAQHGTATPVIVKAPASEVVTCTLADRKGAALPVDGVQLSFGPHVGFGHSGGCVNVSVLPDVPLARAERVRFVWPDGATSVKVVAQSDEARGGVVLKRPDEPCRIQLP